MSTVTVNGQRLFEQVEPAIIADIPEESRDVFIAATTFHLADGRILLGFCSPTDDSLDYVQPVILTPDGLARLWWDWNPGIEVLGLVTRRLGPDSSGIFPISYRCLVPSDGRILEGRIERVFTADDDA